jgi:DNA-binding SARP family transcriptional activator
VAVRGTRRRGLLAYLLVYAAQVVSLDHVVDDLWDHAPSTGVRATVATYVSGLRKLLADDDRVLLETHPNGYMLSVPAECLDVARFESLCAQGAAESDAQSRLGLLDEALGPWRGAPLEEFAGLEWADVEARRLRGNQYEIVPLSLTVAVASGLGCEPA